MLRSNLAPLHPKLLTAKLSKASTLPELLSLHETYGGHFHVLHITAFWSKFMKRPRGKLHDLRIDSKPCASRLCECFLP